MDTTAQRIAGAIVTNGLVFIYFVLFYASG
jgi:hypothetical protein